MTPEDSDPVVPDDSPAKWTAPIPLVSSKNSARRDSNGSSLSTRLRVMFILYVSADRGTHVISGH